MFDHPLALGSEANVKTTTRDRILEAAYHLFYRQGFHAIGVDRIANAANITRQTLYNHFDSKDDILLEVVRIRDRRWQENFRREVERRGGEDPIAQLHSVFDILDEWFQDQEFNGCIFISAASEFPAAADPAHRAAKANFDGIREILAEIAGRARFLDPVDFAFQFSIIVQGAIVTEVIDRQGTTAIGAARLATALIDRERRNVAGPERP